jgi:hypothetical protein
MKTQRFGIEIEMTGITRQRAANTVAEALNGNAECVCGGYDTYKVTAPDGRVWKLVSDASIRAENSRGGAATSEYKVELVSPICRYGDIETVQTIVRALRADKAKVNASCGIHVHIDAGAHTARSLKNLANIMENSEKYARILRRDFLMIFRFTRKARSGLRADE